MSGLSWLAGIGDRPPDVLLADGERTFCRMSRQGHGARQSFIAVVPFGDRPAPAMVGRLSHEFELRDQLDGAWALRPLDLIPQSGRHILFLEDDGGEPLERMMGEPMEVGRFLRVAIGMTVALKHLHERGLVHKDLKPANVFVNPAGEVRLTGFGIASSLPRERHAPEAPEVIAGTLAYMAPEQTGRMNRSIDSRSDLYSLGVTFYQMLCGALPFTASDPMGWVHCHIARLPVPPAERVQVPATVSGLIMRLLVKTAEDRYQTAAGVEADLRRCLAEWEATHQIARFTLGRHDTPDRLLVPEKLYGREQEVETLLAAFDRVVQGAAPELVLVSGYSGIGKSSVVNELHKVLAPPRGLFASGKFDQYQRDVPYSTLAQAFQSLTRRLLAMNEAELAHWRDAFREALGPNGRLMTELVPELALIIGEQPPIPELPPQQAQSRFQLVFRRFIGVFARPEHPLALALDDLQWLDAATLDLVEDLLTQADLRNLLLIGAYRDNEVNAAHPLVRKLEAIRRGGTQVHDLRLLPLARDDLRRLIADALHCQPARAEPLADLLHEKTAGNPFFAIQFLAELAEEGLVAFEHEQARWSWDLARIHAKGYTANVVDLMVGKLSRLPDQTATALQQLACFGNRAETSALALARGASESQVDADLSEAVRLELIERLDSGYKFVHDRVHEAAHGMVGASERAAAHLRIGRLLLAGTVPDALEDAVFDIVNHFNHSAALIDTQEERDRVAGLNVMAGKRARRSTAYVSARNYLAQAAALAAPDAWVRRYEASLELHLLLAECEYLAGNFDAAVALFDTLLREATSDLDKAKVHSLRIKLYALAGNFGKALAVGLDALRSFGVEFPEADEAIEAAFTARFGELPHRLDGRAIGDLLTAPVADDPVTPTIIDLLVASMPCAYFARPPLFPLLTLEAVIRSIRDGNSDQSSFAFGAFALCLVSMQDISTAFEFSEFSLRLNERFDNRRLRGPLLHLHADHVNFWRRHFATGLPIMEQAFAACLEVGDLMHAGMQAKETIWHLIEKGDALEEVLSAAIRFEAFAKQSHNDAVGESIRLQQRFVNGLLGRTAEPLDLGQVDFDAEPAFLNIMRMMLAVLGGRYAEAIEAAEKAEPVLGEVMAMPLEATFHFFHSLALAAHYPAVPHSRQENYLRLLEDKRRRLGFWAEHCPENFENRVALVGAEIARLQGRELDAERLYEQAIRSAAANGFVHHEALAYETAARFHAARGFEDFGALYLRKARLCYQRWGAGAKVRQLDETHLLLRAEGRALPQASTIGAPVEHLDLATVIKVSQAVSGEIVFEKLLDTLMLAAMEHAGAQRGLLILTHAGVERIAAEVTTRGDKTSVRLCDQTLAEAAVPQSVVRYVIRTRESVILDDAAAQGPFADDPYIRERKARSILSLPLLNRGKLIGVLYLENNLAERIFAPARMVVLRLLASEAAVSLENARLYRDLAAREARIRRLVDANIIGIFIWDYTGRILDTNDAFLQMVGYSREDFRSRGLRWTDLTPPEWVDRDQQLVPELKLAGSLPAFEKEYFRKDGSRVPVLIGVAAYEDGGKEGVAFVLDLTDRKRAEREAREGELRYHQMQLRLADANRVATVGQLSASVAHEVNQPLSGIISNAATCLRALEADPPNAGKALDAARRIVRDGKRAAEVITRLRAMFAKREISLQAMDLNDATREVIELCQSELQRHQVVLQPELAEDLPPVVGDRTQLQQVILNLLRNAVEAMGEVHDRPRHLTIRTERESDGTVSLRVRDVGSGLDPESMAKLFDAFYTTKSGGMGIGLSVSQSIIQRHQGRIWAEPNSGPGATFAFSIPLSQTPSRPTPT